MASNTDSGTNFNLCYSHRPNPPVLTSQRSSWWETLQWGKHVWSAGENKNIQIICAIYLSFCPKMTLVLNQWVLNEWICALFSREVPEGRVWQELQSHDRCGFRNGAFRGARRSLQSTAVSTTPLCKSPNRLQQSHSLAFSAHPASSEQWIWRKSYGEVMFKELQQQSPFLNAAVTLVSESWIKWFAFIKFSAQSSACLHLIQFLHVLKVFTVCAQADVHINLHHSI